MARGYFDRTGSSDVADRWRGLAFNEEAAYRSRMKDIEEHATSDEAARPGTLIAGHRTMIAHRLGEKFDVQIRDPFTKKMKTVVRHDYGPNGKTRTTGTAWVPGDPDSVAAVFGLSFVSAFGDVPGEKSRQVLDREAAERAAAAVETDALVTRTRELKERELVDADSRRYRGWIGTPKETRIPPSARARMVKWKMWDKDGPGGRTRGGKSK